MTKKHENLDGIFGSLAAAGEAAIKIATKVSALSTRVYYRVSRNRPGMNPCSSPPRIGVVYHPYGALDVMAQNKYMATASRSHSGRWGSARKSEPVRREKKVAHRSSKHFDRGSAAAKRTGGAPRWMRYYGDVIWVLSGLRSRRKRQQKSNGEQDFLHDISLSVLTREHFTRGNTGNYSLDKRLFFLTDWPISDAERDLR